MLFLVPSCTEFLVVGRVLKTFGDLQALFRMQPLRVVKMCEKYLVIYNIDKVVYNTDIYFQEVQALFRMQPLHVVRMSFWLIKIVTTPSLISIIFSFTKVFYFANLFLSESRHQPQSFSLAPTRQSSQFKNLGKDPWGRCWRLSLKRRWEMVTVLSTVQFPLQTTLPSAL